MGTKRGGVGVRTNAKVAFITGAITVAGQNLASSADSSNITIQIGECI
jgi:hypothetical protein